MPPNMQRLLPFFLILLVLLFIVPALVHKSKSTGPSSSTVSTETIAAVGLVDKAEQTFKASHKGYSSHVADLLELAPTLGHDLADGVVVNLDVSSDGQTYYAQVASSVISLVRGRTGTKQIAKGCLVLKNSSGVKCPVAPVATATTTTTK